MPTFVLVPGFWLGGWAWQRVAALLRTAGHDVYPVTLTGLGERVHLSGPQVDLDTHITDILNLVRFEDLHSIVLVGHSGANLAITGVADRMPERIVRLVYVDAGPLPSGVAQIDFNPPEVQARYRRRVAEEGDGWRLPLPSWEELDQGATLDGLGEAERTLMRARATDQPFATAVQALQLNNPAHEALPKTAIWCTSRSAQAREMVARGLPLFSALAGPQWQFVDLPTGHWPMFSQPGNLADLLAAVAQV